jgi:outer membrane biosynthesis protein TonB
MKEEKNNIKYSAEDIRRYLNGDMTNPEMQALEKAALEDPFLADAIEGLEESRKHSDSFESGITDLQNRLAVRISQRKRETGIIYWLSKWQVAASVITIIGTAVFMVTYVNNKTHSANISITPKKDIGIENTGSSKVKPDADTTASASVKPELENIDSFKRARAIDQIVVSNKPSDARKIPGNKKEKTLALRNNEMLADKKTGEPLANSAAKNSVDTIGETEKSEGYTKKELPAPVVSSSKETFLDEKVAGVEVRPARTLSGNYIKGLVIDNKGAPIAFAEVRIKGSDRHVFTDTAGFFKLYMQNPRLAALISIQPAGYESVSAELKPDSTITNTFQTQPASVSRKGVVVLEYKKPSPFVGWEDFYNYINVNKKINTTDSLLKGEEIISFMVHPDGNLSSFKIEKSISPAHDARILQLIKTAPPLKLQNGKKQRGRINIYFK